MQSEEEKKAIEQIKQLIKFTEGLFDYSTENKSFKIVLKLIEKQQKEIEELKSQLDFIDEQNRYIDKLEKEIEELNSEFAINTEIHKRDIRIKELEEINNCLHETLLGGKDE